MNRDFSPWVTVVMITMKIANNQKIQICGLILCAQFFYGEQPVKNSEKSQQVLSEIKYCNHQIFNFVKNSFKVKN